MTLSFILPTVIAMGCRPARRPDEYFESQGRTEWFTVDQVDDYLLVATFVTLKDNSVHRARMYRYQTHHTLIGVRSVEKGVGDCQVTTKRRPQLVLPVDSSIETYLLLIFKPVVKDKKVTGYSEWSLLQVPAAESAEKKSVIIPSQKDFRIEGEKEQQLLENLRAMFETAHAETIKRQAEPIKHDTKRPWWAW